MDASLLHPAHYFHNLSMVSLRNGDKMAVTCWPQPLLPVRDEIRFTFLPFLLGNLFVLLTRSLVQGCKKDAAGRRTSELPPLGEG